MRISLTIATVALAATLGSAPAVATAAAPTRAQAERAALTALRARSGSKPLVVFRGGLLTPGTRIAAAGQLRLAAPRASSAASRRREALLRAAEVQVVSAPTVARVGRERTWFFYADEAPYQAYQHPGRVVLVGAASGRVTVSRTLQWPPLLNGRLPYFLRSYSAYRNPRLRAFARLWRAGRGTTAAPADPLAPASDPLPAAGAQAAAAQLAAERSCVVRVGDTLGNFYDASAFDQTRAGVGAFFNQLASLDSGFVSVRYRVASGTSLRRYVARLVGERGCRDVLLYLAGGGYVNGGEPAVSVGIQGRADGRLEQQAISASLLRTIVADHPVVTFKLQLDAPGSGAVAARLAGLPNLILLLASSRQGAPSFTALPDLARAGGGTLRNSYNADGLLEFSNRGLRGLRCFVADPAEVATAAADKAAGRSRSFLAAMLWRAYQLCGEGSLLDVVTPGGAEPPVARLVTPTPVPPAPAPPAPQPPTPGPPAPNPPDPEPPTPPAPNSAPTAAAVAVESDEDEPVSFTLAGADPDGDPLTYALVAQPAHGAVSGGDSAARTFTPDPDWHGVTSFDYTVSDGRGGSATGTVTITVAPVADAPVVDAGSGALTWTEGDSALTIAPALTLSEADGEQIASATVTITTGHEAGADVLAAAPAAPITAAWDDATGTLRLTGDASPAAYETALRGVTFASTSDRPSGAPRTIAFAAVDSGGDRSAPASRSLAVVPVNAPPTLTGISATPLSFTEGDAPLGLATAAVVGDSDDPSLGTGGVTVAISGGFAAGEDTLAATGAGGVTSAYDASTGVLRLTGDATPAAYQTVLRTVTYANASEDPSGAHRTVTITVDDGSGGTAQRTLALTVTPVDDPPVVTTSGGATAYTGGAISVDPGLTISDPDDTELTGATVTIAAGFDADDLLTVTAAGGIGFSYDAPDGVLTLTGSASLAAYQQALRSVTYSYGGSTFATTRTISFAVENGSLSNTASKTLSLSAAPVVTLPGGDLAYTEGDGAVALDAAATVADGDSARLTGVTVTIGAGYEPAADVLAADVSGTALAADWDPVGGVLSLTGDDTVAAYQRALRAVTFRNGSSNPSTATRTVTVTADDGVLSGSATTSVTVTAVDSAPIVTATGGATEYVEDDAGVVIDAGLTVSDVDSLSLTGATVSISAGRDSADELLFVNQNGITGSFNSGTGVLTLSGGATVAGYQVALRSVRFRSVGDDPSTATRTISFTAADATSSGTAATKAVSVRAVDDAPTVTSGATLAYTENDPATAIDPALTVGDVDSARLAGATVSVGSGFASGEDELGFVNANGITGSFSPGSGVLTLSGDATVADYQAALRSVTYRNSSDRPSTAGRGITFMVNDGSLTGSDTAVVTVRAVDDAPSAPGVSSDTVGNTRLAYGTARPSGRAARVVSGRSLLDGVTDVDSAGPFTAVAETVASAQGGSAAINADGTFDYTPSMGFAGSDSFTYRVAATSAPGVVGSGRVTVVVGSRVWYVDNSAAAGGDGRSHDPFDTLAEATSASTAGDVIYLFAGDGGTTGTGATATLKLNQRLLGERSPLVVVGGQTLYDGDASKRPQIAGAVALANGSSVRGLRLSGGVSGSGLSGGSILDDLVVASASGTAISLSSNSGGTITLNDVDVSNAGGDAVVIADSGTVAFAQASSVDISAGGGGRALVASGTTVSGQIDSLTTSATTSGAAVSLTRVAGPLTLDDLDLRATDAGALGLLLDDATSVTVNASGDGRIDAAGQAVALRTSTTTPAAGVQPQVALTTVRSAGGAYGVELNDVGEATFRAAGGSLAGQSTAAFAISGGSGDVTWGGAIGDGSGASVSISGRSGGAIRFGGAISDGADAGGGISATGIGGGSIAFSAPGPTLSTGSSAAVDLGFNGAGSVSFSGGSSSLTTTSGDAFSARTSSGSGTVSVTGSGNVARSTSGAALRIDGPDIAAAGVRFQSLTSNGAVSGLVLRDTGSAGGLTVTGDGGLGSGGTLAGSTGPGADLLNTRAVALTDMRITGGADDGIRGSGVDGMMLTRPTLSDNGDAIGESNVELSQPSGAIALADATVTRAGYRNLQSASTSGTAAITITGGAWGLTTGASGDDSVNVDGSGSSIVGLTVDGVDFAMSGGDHIQVTSAADATSTLTATVRDSILSGVIGLPGGGITFNPGGSARLRATVSGTTITGAALEAITIATPGSDVSPQPVTIDATISGNTIGSGGAAASGASNGNGIGIRATGGATVRTALANNQIRQYSNTSGIRLLQSDSGGSLDATVSGNTIAQPNGLNALYGLYATAGSGSGTDNGTLCLDLSTNTMTGSGQSGLGGFDINLRRRDLTTVRLPGYAGTAGDATQLASFLSGRNLGAGASVGTGGSGFTGGAACAAPQ